METTKAGHNQRPKAALGLMFFAARGKKAAAPFLHLEGPEGARSWLVGDGGPHEHPQAGMPKLMAQAQ